jgi:hypothetical protein
MSVVLKRRTRPRRLEQIMENQSVAPTVLDKRIGFPGKSEKEAWEFSEAIVHRIAFFTC